MSATATHTTEHSETTTIYGGPERRVSTREERSAFLRQRRMRRDLLNWIGKGSIGVAVAFGCFWVGRVERHIGTGDEAMRTLSATVETVRILAEAVRDIQNRERVAIDQRNGERTTVLLELQKLNGQVESLRIESQGRAVAGRRDP